MILSLQRIQHTNSIGIIGNAKTGTVERKGRQAMYIELKNINKSFGDFQASKEVNFAIEKGKLVGFSDHPEVEKQRSSECLPGWSIRIPEISVSTEMW